MPADPLGDDALAEALADGPFSRALRLAVKSSGLSLERVQFRLRERDAPVSKTALSNWQSGRTQPERPESLRALAVLEDLVGLPRESLSRLLGPPRPRGRWLSQSPGDLPPDQGWARPDGLERALQQISDRLDSLNKLSKVALQVTCVIAEDKTMQSVHYQAVLRACADDIDRHTAAYRSDVATISGPFITDAIGCRRGRQREDNDTGFTTFELLLDHPVRTGELVNLQYVLHPRSGQQDLYYTQRLEADVSVFAVQVKFSPGALPVRVYRRYKSAIGEEDGEDFDVSVGASYTAQFSITDPRAGIYRLGWDWE
ncbi:MAG: hypothetical protein M3548_14685 [Actinomycetota bacterium]|nr:hypothetical protein [Actinomycetota bacterium]